MESEDYAFYQSLVYLMDNNIEHLGYDLTFSTEVSRFFSTVHISFSLVLISYFISSFIDLLKFIDCMYDLILF